MHFLEAIPTKKLDLRDISTNDMTAKKMQKGEIRRKAITLNLPAINCSVIVKLERQPLLKSSVNEMRILGPTNRSE